MRQEEFYFDSRDQKTKIHAVKWIPDVEKPIAILQISHGMAEYILRYQDFAKAMTDKGFLVVGNDHLGHGQSKRKEKPFGYFCERDAATVVVRDVHRLKKLVQEDNPGVPYFILGHSMGSFILRNYIFRYGKGIDGAILVGTGNLSALVTKFGKLFANGCAILKGVGHISYFMQCVAFGNYNKRIKQPKTEFDWLAKDEGVVNNYIKDPGCGFVFTLNGYLTLFELIERACNKKNMKEIPSGLPIYVLAGEEDPVGNYGKGVRTACNQMKLAGCRDITLKLYKNNRHEILNDKDKQQVYASIYSFIINKIKC